ncbi:MAG TPA: hypothetical protein VGT41_02975 [Candidatus Babeliales bacterium]|nr:hypothetical protein [Candidatus Babeliales bacterium]
MKKIIILITLLSHAQIINCAAEELYTSLCYQADGVLCILPKTQLIYAGTMDAKYTPETVLVPVGVSLSSEESDIKESSESVDRLHLPIGTFKGKITGDLKRIALYNSDGLLTDYTVAYSNSGYSPVDRELPHIKADKKNDPLQKTIRRMMKAFARKPNFHPRDAEKLIELGIIIQEVGCLSPKTVHGPNGFKLPTSPKTRRALHNRLSLSSPKLAQNHRQ